MTNTQKERSYARDIGKEGKKEEIRPKEKKKKEREGNRGCMRDTEKESKKK